MIWRDLTEDEEAEVAAMNAEVAAALEKRRKRLDEMMYEISVVKPGDVLFSANTATRIGRLVRLERCNNDHHGVYDTSPVGTIVVYEEFTDAWGRKGRTKRASDLGVCTKEQALQRLKMELERVRLDVEKERQ